MECAREIAFLRGTLGGLGPHWSRGAATPPTQSPVEEATWPPRTDAAMGLGVEPSEFCFTVWPWQSYLSFLSLHILICRRGYLLTSQNCCEDQTASSLDVTLKGSGLCSRADLGSNFSSLVLPLASFATLGKWFHFCFFPGKMGQKNQPQDTGLRTVFTDVCKRCAVPAS